MSANAISIETRSGRPFDETLAACREALASEGLGVLHEFDFRQAVLTKTGTDIGPYHVLAACHPPSASVALSALPEVGVLLPCNVAVFERDGEVQVHAVDPRTQLSLLDRVEISDIAGDIFDRLSRVIEAVAGPD